MQDKAERNRIAVNIWTARIIPIILAGVVGYATYVLVALLSVNYLLVKYNDQAAAISILVIYFLLFLLMTISFLRLIHITIWDPPYLPLGQAASQHTHFIKSKENSRNRGNTEGVANGEYDAGYGSRGTSSEAPSPQNDPDSPGLELFYSKDVFTCEMDGKPRWCSQCSNWKPDRAHHCGSSGRCILKMDHFCPWVGGPIGENNFKFFLQFTCYTALYCLHLLVVMAVYVHRQVVDKSEGVNSHFCAILGLATFFGLFTAGMTGTSLDLALRNLTQVENLGAKTRTHILAVLKPSPDQLSRVTPTLPLLSYPEIVYPLRARENSGNLSENMPNSVPKDTLLEKFSAPDQTHQSATTTVVASAHHDANLSLSNSTGIAEENLNAAVQPPSLSQNMKPREALSARDLRASRRFAILRMPQGDNPWDLGSRFLNMQALMGISLIDWLLPFKRSPCCNHENKESHFAIGPSVDELKVTVSFINKEDVRLAKNQTKAKRRRRRPSNNLAKRDETYHSPQPNSTSDMVQMNNLS